MSWIVYADPFETTTALADGSFDIYTTAVFPENTSLTVARAWFVLYNDPTFTNLKMRIYNTRDVLLAESTNSVTKADLLTTEVNGHKETYFLFNKFSVRANEEYRFRIVATGYTYSVSSFVAWTRAYPDPVYRLNADLTYTGLLKSAYTLYFGGAQI
jgi:hypothetical protein